MAARLVVLDLPMKVPAQEIFHLKILESRVSFD
jgi:hypothetical protein